MDDQPHQSYLSSGEAFRLYFFLGCLIVTLFFLTCEQAVAVLFDDCASAAKRLRDAANEASSAKSSFESACGSFGYSRATN